MAEGQSVWIGYVDGKGCRGAGARAAVSIGGGVVEGRDALDGELRRMPLHRITWIAVVDS